MAAHNPRGSSIFGKQPLAYCTKSLQATLTVFGRTRRQINRNLAWNNMLAATVLVIDTPSILPFFMLHFGARRRSEFWILTENNPAY